LVRTRGIICECWLSENLMGCSVSSGWVRTWGILCECLVRTFGILGECLVRIWRIFGECGLSQNLGDTR
jgi:hypothetical protein